MEGEGPITTRHSSWRLSCFLAGLLVFASLAVAQQPQQRNPLLLEARVGWDSAVRFGAWTPVAVWLDWRGDREIRGLLRVRPAGGAGPAAEAWVTLSPPSRKRVDVTIPFRPEAGEVVVEFLSSALDRPVEIRRSPRIWIDEDDILLVIVERGSRVPESAHTWCRQFSWATKGREAVAVGVEPRDLPRRWADYEPVDLLVLQEFGDVPLDPGAAAAIARWVSVGGRVLVTAESDPAVFETTPLWNLLPVAPGAVQLLESLPGPFAGSPGDSAGPGSVFTRSFLPRTDVETNRWPDDSTFTALVGRSIGGGWIGFSPLAPGLPPLKDADTGALFWANTLRFSNSPRQPLLDIPPLHSEPSPTWWGPRRAPDGQPFPLPALAIYLFLYFALVGPANYFFLRRKRRFELVWVTVPVISLAFFLFAYLGGRILWGTRAAVREITIIEALPPLAPGGPVSPARSVSRIRVNSPSRAAYDVDFPERNVFLAETLPNNPDAVKEHGFNVLHDAGTRVDDLRVNMWSSRFLCAHDVRDVSGSIGGTARASEGRIHGTVAVDLPFHFDAACVYFKGERAGINLADDIGARGEGKRHSSYQLSASADRRARASYPGYMDLSRSDPNDPRTILDQALYYLESSYGISDRGMPYFIGIRAAPSGSLLVNGRDPGGYRSTVYVAALPIEADRDEIDLPPDLWREEFRDPNSLITPEYGTFNVRPGEVEWDFFGPPALNNMTVREMNLLVLPALLRLADRFEILDQSNGKWVPLPREGPEQDKMTLVNPPGSGGLGRFVEPGTARVSIRMNLTKSERIQNREPGSPYNYGTWMSTDRLVDIHVRGTAK